MDYRDGLPFFGLIVDGQCMAFPRHQAAQTQSRIFTDGLRQRQYRSAGQHARPVHACVDFDHQSDLDARVDGCPVQLVQSGRAVHGHFDVDGTGKVGQSGVFASADKLIGNQEIAARRPRPSPRPRPAWRRSIRWRRRATACGRWPAS